MSPIVTLAINVVSIYFVFYLLQPVDFTKIMPKNPNQAAILKVVIATILGFLLATAMISLVSAAQEIPNTVLKLS
ncbi:DUF1146 family protein [Fructobacillus ficulneus]|uniref:Uncharacterized protein n=1 Tax=Fructobacillus ficulneus TaxID=157463 RepID=A0A0K8MFX2_9LACO|nr:DUF1146 family protein [Fructobacillus ficulneus]GAO99387.1 hypothetical protein FFIC_092200 [Fructobacillus ficulneus]